MLPLLADTLVTVIAALLVCALVFTTVLAFDMPVALVRRGRGRLAGRGRYCLRRDHTLLVVVTVVPRYLCIV